MSRSAVRANGQSQATYSQRRHRPSQSQRGRRPDPERDEDDEDEGTQNEILNGETGIDDGQDEITRKASALVRLALFHETRRTPLRRDEINKRVLGENTRSFGAVYQVAQKILENTFGMELVELMSRAERERDKDEPEEEGEKNGTGLKKKGGPVGSKTYILRSLLPEDLIHIASIPREDLIDLEYDNDADDDAPQPPGTIIDWNSADQLSGSGILMVILSLILVSGHTMSDPELKTHLKTFNIPLNATLELTPHSREHTITVEAFLTSMIKQNYLDRIKVGTAGAPRPTQGKRSRGRNMEEEGVSYEWRWGSRAFAEFGERAVADFISQFMVERIVKEKEESGANMNSEDTKKVIQNMMKDIAQAAGGKLNEVR